MQQDLIPISSIFVKEMSRKKVFDFLLEQPSDFATFSKKVVVNWRSDLGAYTPVDNDQCLLLNALRQSGVKYVRAEVVDLPSPPLVPSEEALNQEVQVIHLPDQEGEEEGVRRILRRLEEERWEPVDFDEEDL